MKYKTDNIILNVIASLSILAVPIISVIKFMSIKEEIGIDRFLYTILTVTGISLLLPGVLVLFVQRARPTMLFNVAGYIGLGLIMAAILLGLIYLISGGLDYGTINVVGIICLIIGLVIAIRRSCSNAQQLRCN